MKPDDPTPRHPRGGQPEPRRLHCSAVAADFSGSTDPLAEALRREATRTRPVFSPARHARLSEALAAAESDLLPLTAGPRRWRAALGLSLAAAVAGLVWLAWPRTPDTRLPVEPAISTAAAPSAAQPSLKPGLDPGQLTELAHDTALGVGTMMDEALSEATWRYLGDDAAAAWDVVRTALKPLTPSRPPNARG